MSQSIDESTIQGSVKALFTFLARKEDTMDDSKKELLEDDDFIYLIITLKKIPEKKRNSPFRIEIPHPIYGVQSGGDICVIVSDKRKDTVKAQLQQQPIQGITKVLSVQKLRKEFRPYEARRDLVNSFELFLTDDAVVPVLPSLLGKKFFEKKKQPVPVPLSKEKSMLKELQKARDSTYFFLPTGACCLLKVARTSFSRQQICENITACVNKLFTEPIIPKKHKNIQSIFLKTKDSVALPVWKSLPIEEREEKEKKEKEAKKQAKKEAKKEEQKEPQPLSSSSSSSTPASAKKQPATASKKSKQQQKQQEETKTTAMEDEEAKAPATAAKKAPATASKKKEQPATASKPQTAAKPATAAKPQQQPSASAKKEQTQPKTASKKESVPKSAAKTASKKSK